MIEAKNALKLSQAFLDANISNLITEAISQGKLYCEIPGLPSAEVIAELLMKGYYYEDTGCSGRICWKKDRS